MSSTQLMQKRRLGNFIFTLFGRLLIRCDSKEGQVDTLSNARLIVSNPGFLTPALGSQRIEIITLCTLKRDK
jgi:hypothetical protein